MFSFSFFDLLQRLRKLSTEVIKMPDVRRYDDGRLSFERRTSDFSASLSH